jgi:hypothetical protein
MRNLNPFREGYPETWYAIYLTSGVLTSGTQRIQEAAESILATLDSAVEDFREAARGDK